MTKILPLNNDNVLSVADIDAKSFKQERWSLKSFQDEIGDFNKIYSVVYVENDIVGFGNMTQILDEGHIMKIAVLPNHRRCGIGKVILEDLIEKGLKRGIRSFTLEVRKSNCVAQHLYESTSFVNVGIRKGYYPDKEDACIYWLYK